MRSSLRLSLTTVLLLAACSAGESGEPGRTSAAAVDPFAPTAVYDLGVLVTEDLPQRSLGVAFMTAFGGGRSNSFEVLPWSFESPVGNLEGSDAFYTLFNHAGPHVDAPNHMSVGGGIDSYSVEQFVGPMKVFDAREFEPGRTIPVDVFRGSVAAGDVVAIYTGYEAPTGSDELPVVVTITQEAAEYLATLPVRAFGTDAAGVESGQETAMGIGETPGAILGPVHDAFLSRGIPVYEQLNNLEQLLGKSRLFFTGAPLNIAGGDGMLVRPIVFEY